MGVWKTPIVSTQINKTAKARLIQACNEDGISICEYIRQAIFKDLAQRQNDRLAEPSGQVCMACGQNVHTEADTVNKGIESENIIPQQQEKVQEIINVQSPMPVLELQKFMEMIKRSSAAEER